MKKILNYLFEHKTLTRQEAEEVLTNIARGYHTGCGNCSFSYRVSHAEHYGGRTQRFPGCPAQSLHEGGSVGF